MPKFKYRDIVKMYDGKDFYYVMDFHNGVYFFDDYDGKGSTASQEMFERNFYKIGEVTDDVIKRVNPNFSR